MTSFPVSFAQLQAWLAGRVDDREGGRREEGRQREAGRPRMDAAI